MALVEHHNTNGQQASCVSHTHSTALLTSLFSLTLLSLPSLSHFHFSLTSVPYFSPTLLSLSYSSLTPLHTKQHTKHSKHSKHTKHIKHTKHTKKTKLAAASKPLVFHTRTAQHSTAVHCSQKPLSHFYLHPSLLLTASLACLPCLPFLPASLACLSCSSHLCSPM